MGEPTFTTFRSYDLQRAQRSLDQVTVAPSFRSSISDDDPAQRTEVPWRPGISASRLISDRVQSYSEGSSESELTAITHSMSTPGRRSRGGRADRRRRCVCSMATAVGVVVVLLVVAGYVFTNLSGRTTTNSTSASDQSDRPEGSGLTFEARDTSETSEGAAASNATTKFADSGLIDMEHDANKNNLNQQLNQNTEQELSRAKLSSILSPPINARTYQASFPGNLSRESSFRLDNAHLLTANSETTPNRHWLPLSRVRHHRPVYRLSTNNSDHSYIRILSLPERSCAGADLLHCLSRGVTVCAVRCDGRVECDDLADEYWCNCADRLPDHFLCDGYPDCPDQADEAACMGCGADEFACSVHAHDFQQDFESSESVECFSKQQQCDGFSDCFNGRDEQLCFQLTNEVSPSEGFLPVLSSGYLQANVAGAWLPVCWPPDVADGNDDVTKIGDRACQLTLGEKHGSAASVYARAYRESDVVQFAELASLGAVNRGEFQLISSGQCRSGRAIHVHCNDVPCGHAPGSLSDQLFNLNLRRVEAKLKLNILQKPNLSAHSSSAEGSDIGSRNTKLTSRSVKDDIDIDSGRVRRSHASRIVGGRRSGVAKWPFMAAMRRDGDFTCGATVLSPRWIMTAAHCCHSAERFHIEVQAGMLRRDTYAPYKQSRTVLGVVVHPLYDRQTFTYDIALMLLARPLEFSRWTLPVCVPGPKEIVAVGSVCTVIGWGQTTVDGPESDHLLETEVPVSMMCPEEYDNATIVLCAGRPEGGKDSCQGDSGGPLICRSENDGWVQHGIVSHGRGCALPKLPGAYTRVSYFSDWIHRYLAVDTLSGTEAVEPQPSCLSGTCHLSGGRCLRESHVCDGYVHCLHADDERFCTVDGSEIVPTQYVNDSASTDSQTEPPVESAQTNSFFDVLRPPVEMVSPSAINNISHAIGSQSCQYDEFQCRIVSACISSSRRCDGVADCADYSDESGCSLLDRLIRQHPDRVCDLKVDLPEAADEIGCCVVGVGQFYCFLTDATVPVQWRCDGHSDCLHGEDELGCVALVDQKNNAVQMDMFGRPVISYQGLLAVRSNEEAEDGSSLWQATCVDRNQWSSEKSDLICQYLYHSNSIQEHLVSVKTDLIRETNLPVGNIYTCRDGLSFRTRRQVSEWVASGRGLNTSSTSLPLIGRLSALLRPPTIQDKQEGCLAVFLQCQSPGDQCGIRPLLQNAQQTSSPLSGTGVWPMFGTLYGNGLRIGGAVLISESWILVHRRIRDDAGRDLYLTVEFGQHMEAVYDSGLTQRRRVDMMLEAGDQVELAHLHSPVTFTDLIQPACHDLPSRLPLDEGQTCYAIGWSGGTVSALPLRLLAECGRGRLCFTTSQSQNCSADLREWSGAVVCPIITPTSPQPRWTAVAVYDMKQLLSERSSEAEPSTKTDYGRVLKSTAGGSAPCPAQLSIHAVDSSLIGRILHCINLAVAMPSALSQVIGSHIAGECGEVHQLPIPECVGHRCSSGHCLSPVQVCNGIPECPDGSDELHCQFDVTSCVVNGPACDCGSGRLRCPNSDICWNSDTYCDGRAACLDGADEPEQCSCHHYLWLTEPQRICDRRVDCADGEDEKSCEYEREQFRCYRDPSVHLIARQQLCDTVYQCRDGEDEHHCVCLLPDLPPAVPMRDAPHLHGFNVSENSLGRPTCHSEGFLLMRLRDRWMVVDYSMWSEKRSQRVCSKLGYREVISEEGVPVPGMGTTIVRITCQSN